MLKCYDTLSKQYKEITIDKEMETEIKRSYWREEHAERRYNARVVEYADYMQLNKTRDLTEMVILNDEVAILRECISLLPERSKRIIYYKYFCDMTDVEIGKLIGVSNSYVGRLVKQIKAQLKIEILDQYDYYV